MMIYLFNFATVWCSSWRSSYCLELVFYLCHGLGLSLRTNWLLVFNDHCLVIRSSYCFLGFFFLKTYNSCEGDHIGTVTKDQH